MGKVELKLEIDADLLARARAAGAEPQAVLEAALRALPDQAPVPSLVESARLRALDPEGAERRRLAWSEENRAGIEDFNRRVAEHGLLSDHEPFRPSWLK